MKPTPPEWAVLMFMSVVTLVMGVLIYVGKLHVLALGFPVIWLLGYIQMNPSQQRMLETLFASFTSRSGGAMPGSPLFPSTPPPPNFTMPPPNMTTPPPTVMTTTVVYPDEGGKS